MGLQIDMTMNRNECNEEIISRPIVGMRVDGVSYSKAVSRIVSWAKSGESRYVCVANVHMVMEGYDAREFRNIVNRADMITPDGMPLVWALRLLGFHGQERVCGPDLTRSLCEEAARTGIPVGFFGGTAATIEALAKNLKHKYPGLNIVYTCSPPFRPITTDEDAEIVAEINTSGVKILFVGLGCPKQERWIADHKGRISAVMLGVGAAFDFHAGTLKQAPQWMQHIGMEWFFRLLMEPRRLWKRYTKHNARFLFLILRQILSK